MCLRFEVSQEPRFLSIDEVRDLQKEVVEYYGGQHGLRDEGLLSSAVMGPQQTFGGEFVYPTFPEMAAAYWVGLGKNHAFVDGNKRIGLIACDVFLLLNGYELTLSEEQAIEYTLKVVTSEAGREEAAVWIAENVRDSTLRERHDGP
jgi:death-on-curing protein